MGKVLLVARIVAKDIRHRPVLTILLLLAIAAGVATLTLGLALRGTTADPYMRTRAATAGPDVVATDINGDQQAPAQTTGSARSISIQGAAQPEDLAPLEHAPGIAASSGPFPITWASLHVGHTTATTEVEGRSSMAAAVDRPKVTQGGWIRPGGVVVEATFAQALGLHVGDRLRLGGSSFTVVGTAATAAFPSYPVAGALGAFLVGTLGTNSMGLVWVPAADVAHVAAAASEPVFYDVNLKLADPAAAPAFVDRYEAGSSSAALALYAWQSIRSKEALVTARAQLVLFTGSWLLVLLALASVIVLVGGRMAEHTRRVGLLKAIGATPLLVAMVLLCENALVGLCAAAVGLLAGWLAAPLIDGPGAGLLGAPSAPSLSVSAVVLAVALALGVALAATSVPAIRAARQSTVAALQGAARPPRRRARVIALSARLPAPLLFGALLAVRRPGRLLLSVFSVAVTTSGLVAVLILHVTVNGVLGPVVSQATAVISLMLVVLAAVNAIFIAWTTALEARRPAAVARALGATPLQVASGLSAALLLPAVLGVLLGIPGGIGLHHVAKEAGATPVPPLLWLALMALALLLAITAFTTVPVVIDARRPAAAVLGSETR
jgi:ABC-type lipoprotein release transport system permease subunit